MIASPALLKEVSGLERPSAIRRWLNKQHIRYVDGADNWPKVAEASIMEKLRGVQSANDNEPRLRLKNG